MFSSQRIIIEIAIVMKDVNMKWNDVWEYVGKDLELATRQKLLSLKLAKNIRNSGDVVEAAFAEFLKRFLPRRLKVTAGHIVAIDSKGLPILSPQVDLIIVDTMVPHSLIPFSASSKFDIVPVESVVAFFEVKGSLKAGKKDKMSLYKTCHQLKKIYDMVVPSPSSDRYLPGGIRLGKAMSGGSYSNPMAGILALTSSESLKKEKTIKKYFSDIIPSLGKMPLDLIFVADGLIITPSSMKNGNNFLIDPVRCTSGTSYVYYGTKLGDRPSLGQVVSRCFGVMQCYLKQVVGRYYNPEQYFFH